MELSLSEDMRSDTRSIQKIIEEEFERIVPGTGNDPRDQRRFRFRRRQRLLRRFQPLNLLVTVAYCLKLLPVATIARQT